MHYQVDILMLVHSDYEHDSRVRREARSLVEAGYSVGVIALWTQFNGPMHQCVEHPDGCLIWRQELKYRSGKRRFLEMMRKARRIALDVFQAKVIHAHDLDTLGVGVELKRKWNARLIYDSHEWYTGSIHVEHRLVVRAIWSYLEKKWIKHIDQLITVNNSIADLFIKNYPLSKSNVYVIRNIDEPPAFVKMGELDRNWVNAKAGKTIESFRSKYNKILVYGGYLHRGRGLEDSIEVLRKISTDFAFIVAGEGPILNELIQQASKLGVEDRVLFTGLLNSNDLYRLYMHSDIGLSIIEPLATSYRLSLPNKISQYIQTSLAIIGSDLPEIRAVLSQYNKAIVMENNISLLDAINNISRLIRINKKNEHILSWCEEKNKLTSLYMNPLQNLI